MTEILLIIAIPLSFGLGAFTGVKAIQLGLKYKMQIERGVEPTLNPVRDTLDDISIRQEAKKTNNLTAEMIGDIFGGE